MCTRPEITFDPYGEPIEPVGPNIAALGGHRARSAAAAAFWILAVLMIAGRAHLSEPPVGQGIASLQEQASIFDTAGH
jgi:hypothetical protein